MRLLAVGGDQMEPLFTSGSPGVCSSKSWKFSPTYLWTEWDLDKQLDIQLLHLSKIQKCVFLQKARLAEADKIFTFFPIVYVTSVLWSWRVVSETRASGTARCHTWRVVFSPDQGYNKNWILPFISTSVSMYFPLVLQSLINFRILALT